MPQPNSREAAVQSLLSAFRRLGFDGASLTELSKATGLGKSSLYHHFPGGKEDMAQVVLQHVAAWMRESVLEPLVGPGPPRERLAAMIDTIDRFYSGGKQACILGNFVVGGARDKFGEALRLSFEAWIAALAKLGRDAGVSPQASRRNAEDAVIQIQGALIVAAGLKDEAPFRRALQRLPMLLLGAQSA